MKNSLFLILSLSILMLSLQGCKKDGPDKENEEEIITDVILKFTAGTQTLTFTAIDPDGDGPRDFEFSGPINLVAGTTYKLDIEVKNSIENEDITEEIEEEADEHMFFFGFTSGLFSNPTGTGNISSRSNPINYLDTDKNGLPLGLSTEWTTATVTASSSGTFRVVLKHQPRVKSATSTVNDGESDVDLTWTINVSPRS